jgi:hypothetical protein
MIYKIISQTEEGTIFGRIDSDGKCRLTCIQDHSEFQDYLKNGGALQDADGKTMTAEQAKQFVKELP